MHRMGRAFVLTLGTFLKRSQFRSARAFLRAASAESTLHNHESVTVTPRLDNGNQRMGGLNREDSFLSQLSLIQRSKARIIGRPKVFKPQTCVGYLCFRTDRYTWNMCCACSVSWSPVVLRKCYARRRTDGLVSSPVPKKDACLFFWD